MNCSSLAVPRRRPAWVAFISARNGGKASRRSTSSSPLGRGRPPFLAGPGRELPAQLAVARLRRSRGVGARSCLVAADRVLHDGRHDGRPNSTDSDFGS